MTDGDLPGLPGLELEAPAAPQKRQRRRRLGGYEVLSSGALRVRIRGVTAAGRPFDLARTIASGRTMLERQADADAALAELRKLAAAWKAGTSAPEEHITLADWKARARKRGLVRAYSSSDESAWRGPLRGLWGLRLQDLDDGRIAGWVQRQRDAGRSAAYIRSAWGLLSRLVRAAWAAKVIAEVPFRNPPIPGDAETRTREALTEPELVAVLEAAAALDREGVTDGSLRLRLEWQLETGSRPIECAWLALSDLGRDDRGHPTVLLRAAKGGNDRTVPLPVELASRVAAHVAALPPRALALGVVFPFRTAERPRWRSRLEERRHHGQLERSGRHWILPHELGALRQRSGVAGWEPYQMRHTTHTTRARRGFSAYQLKELGGWRTDRMPSLYVSAGHVAMPAEHVGVPLTPERARLEAGPVLEGDVLDAAPALPVEGGRTVSPSSPRPDRGRALEAHAPALEPLPAQPTIPTVGAPMGAGSRGLAVGADRPASIADVIARHLASTPDAAAPLEAPGPVDDGTRAALAGLRAELAATLAPTAGRPGVKRARIRGTFPNESREKAALSGSRCTANRAGGSEKEESAAENGET